MRVLLAVGCALVVACGGTSSPTSPSQQGPLRLTGSITQTTIPAGGTATITFALTNIGSDTVSITFSDSCQVKPYISSSSGRIVYPEGGGWVCATVITNLTLAPGATKTHDVQLRAASSASYPYVALAAGAYNAFAKVSAGAYTLQSDPIRFSVQ